jgi:DNA-binding response OmpR family regulator
VADQEERAVVVLQQLLEQVEGLDVEVVGRLVEHQHIGRPRKEPRQQQAVALAAGERC